MHHTSQITAAAHWSYLLPERLGQCQKAWQKLMFQWISQSIIITHSCHRREAKSCLQGNPHQDMNVAARGVVLWPRKLLLGCGYFSCAFFLCQLSSLLPKSCLPALPGCCFLVQPWRPPHLWLWRGAQDNTEPFCRWYWLFLVLPLQFFIAFHSSLPGAFGGLICSTKKSPRSLLIHFMALCVFPTTCTLSASLWRHNCRSAQPCLCFIPAPPHTGSRSCLWIVTIWESAFDRISSGNSVQETYRKSRAKYWGEERTLEYPVLQRAGNQAGTHTSVVVARKCTWYKQMVRGE